MSFDVHFFTCNPPNRTEQRKNPFTGQIQSVPVYDSLTASERAGVVSLLNAAGAASADKFGRYLVRTEDGGMAEIFAKQLQSAEQFVSCMVALRSLTPEMSRFMWELSRVGNMFASPEMENPPAIVVTEEQRLRIQHRWPDALIVESAEDLHRLLTGGFEAWRSFRNQITK